MILKNVLLHFQRDTQPVPAEQLIKMKIATLSLISKVQRTPDMTSVHDEINTIHTEVAQNAVRKAKELATIEEELKNLTANVQKGLAASQKAPVAAKEAAEVGKMVTGITRDIKNKDMQHQTGAPTSSCRRSECVDAAAYA
jgi:hypothetical protein